MFHEPISEIKYDYLGDGCLQHFFAKPNLQEHLFQNGWVGERLTLTFKIIKANMNKIKTDSKECGLFAMYITRRKCIQRLPVLQSILPYLLSTTVPAQINRFTCFTYPLFEFCPRCQGTSFQNGSFRSSR